MVDSIQDLIDKWNKDIKEKDMFDTTKGLIECKILGCEECQDLIESRISELEEEINVCDCHGLKGLWDCHDCTTNKSTNIELKRLHGGLG